MPKAEFEPGPRESGTGPKYAELFDIYLLSFAGDERAAAAELERAFLIEPATARKMVREAPLVVKRGVEPELASQYIDVLARLGAQVVLLPATQPSEPSPAEVALPPSEPAPAPLAPGGSSAAHAFAAPGEETAVAAPGDGDAFAGSRAEDPFAEPSMPAFMPSEASLERDLPPALGATPPPAVPVPMAELPRLGTPTVFEASSPFDAVPAPKPSWAATSSAEAREVPSADAFGADEGGPGPADAATDADGFDFGPAFTPVPPPAAPEESWLSPLPQAPARAPGSGLFMAASADEFVAPRLRSTEMAPLPVIKPLRERPRSEAPTPPAARPPPAPPARSPSLAPPPGARTALVRSPASVPPPPPPSRATVSEKLSIPPPVPVAATVVTMSRRPPPVLEADDDGVLQLDLDKVPPLPTLSVAPRALDVDPGDLASLPRIELDAVKRGPKPDGAPPSAGVARASGSEELASLPPMTPIKAPVPAPAIPAAPPPKPAAAALAAAAPRALAGAAARPPVPAAAPASRVAPAGRARFDALTARLPSPSLSGSARRALYAVGLFACAVAIVGLGVRLDDSVLFGNASLPAVLLHAFAFYAVGAGVFGMIRS